jgi:xanthine/CO dehydrogenase XdhC/CoxF family maturation factor
MASDSTALDGLRYLDADHVKHPSGTFANLMLCSRDRETLGAISGVLVEPSARRVRYYVVERRSMLMPRRYLLAADTPAVIDSDGGKVHVLATAEDLEHFDVRGVERFSDEDAITAMFARPAA